MGHEVAGVKEALQQFEHAPCKLVAERPAKSLPLFRFYPSAKTLYSVQKRQERPDPYRADLRRLMAFPTTKTSSPVSGRLRRAESRSDAGKASRRGPIDGIITADYSMAQLDAPPALELLKQIRKSSDRFQLMVETTKVLPCELDLLTWRFTYVGPQAERMLGYPLDDWYAKGFWSAHVRLEDPNAIAPLCDTADFCARDHEFTCRMLAKNGKEIPFHCVVRSMAGENGARILRGFMMDISEMKAMEEALARHAEELARSNAELQQFASIASHDLQEPLRMVSFYTQLLAKRYKGKLDADADEFIGYAAEGATRMANLIRHLLEYSRVSSRKPDFAPIDCEAVFEQSLTNLQMALKESGAVVTHDPLPQVEGDATQLVQLLQNLIGNAIKFRRPEMTAQVHVAVEEKATEWIFSVRDNGIGIEQEYYDTIFAIFQQLHSRDKYEGSGVGLAICRRIVERHRGRIWVDSTPGEGTTFHFTLAKTPRKGGVNLAKTGTFGGSSDAR